MANSSLEKLIKSLSRGELKTFSLSIKNNQSPEYYKLFRQLKAEKGIASNSDSNAQRRKYLYDSLLESLNRNVDSIDSEIIKKLLNTETLFKRQLVKESWKEVNKAQKLAQKHERFGILIQILEYKKSIGFYLDSFTRQNHLELSQFEEKVLNQQLIYLKTKNLYMEILGLKKEVGYLDVNFNRISFSKFDVEIAPDMVSKRALFYSKMTKAIYHWMLKEHNEEYLLTKQIIDETDVKIDTTEYLIGNLEHLTSCVCNATFNELLLTLKHLKEKYYEGFFGNSKSIELKLFYYAANYEIMSYAYLGDSEKLKIKVEEVEKGIKYWSKNLSNEMLVVIYSALKLAYYLLEDKKKSSYYINRMLSESSRAIRKDAFEDALLFNLILAFDKNDLDFQESTLIKTFRYLRNNKMQESFEYKLVVSLKKNLTDDNIFKNVYDELEIEFDNYFYKLIDGRYYSENYLPIYTWLVSKIKKEPIIEIIKKWSINEL